VSIATKAELYALADRVEACTASNNNLDVLIEVALFVPHGNWCEVRANAAGTKVVYTNTRAQETVCWAYDWTRTPDKSARALRAKAEAL
jgi:hypothetical protein